MKLIRSAGRLYSTIMSFPSQAIQIDRYRCASIFLEKVDPEDPVLQSVAFDKWLKSVESDWHRDQIRGIWFLVPLSHAATIPILVKNDFVYHHAKAEQVAMLKWISEKETNNIPPYAFTNVGVGGLVVDSKNRLLVIQEKYPVRGLKLWKFPGGVGQQGEEIGEIAEREVFEETGIKAKFDSILSIRHLHKYQFGCSDLYIVCLLTVDESDPAALTLTRCEQEIDAVQWMPLEEAMECMSEYNRFIAQKYLMCKETGFSIGHDQVEFIVGGKLSVYSLKKTEKDPV